MTTFHNKLARWVAALVLLASVIWGIGWFVVSNRLDKGLFESKLSQSLGIAIKIESVSLDWRGRLQLDNLQLATGSGLPLGTIKQAVADVETAPLLRGHLQITRLSLEQMHLTLSNAISQELSKIPGASSLRAYPIRLTHSSVEWQTGTSAESYSVGPLMATSPVQTVPGQNVFQALLGSHTLLNVTLQDGNADFVLDTRGGDGLPKAWAEALKAEDHLRVSGQWKGGNLTVDGQVATTQVEAPLHIEWKQSERERILLTSSAVTFGGSHLGAMEARLLIDQEKAAGLGLEIEGKSPLPWQARGNVGHDGAVHLKLTSTARLSRGQLTVNVEMTKAAGQGPLVVEGNALLTRATWGPRPLPDFLLSLQGQSEGQGFKGQCSVGLARGKPLASGHLQWASKVGWTAQLATVALKPELLQGFPLEGTIRAQASWPPGKPVHVELEAAKLGVLKRELSDVKVTITPQDSLASGSAKLAKTTALFTLQPGKFSLEAKDVSLVSLGLAGPVAGKFDLKLQGDPEKGLESADFLAIRLTYDGKQLPELSSTWKRAESTPLWRCQSIQTPQHPADRPKCEGLTYNSDKRTLQGQITFHPLKLEELQKLTSNKMPLHGTLQGKLVFKGRQAQFQGSVDNFQTPAWHCPRLALVADLRAPEGGALTYSLRGTDSEFTLPPATGLRGKGQLLLLLSSADPQPRLEMKIPQLQLEGKPPLALGPFQARGSLGKDGKTVSLSLALPRLATKLAGSFNADSADLKGTMEGLNLALLCSEKTAGSLSGKISMSGKMAEPHIRFQGETRGLEARGRKLGSFAVSFDQIGKKSTLDVPEFPLGNLLGGVSGKAHASYSRNGDKSQYVLTAPDLKYQDKALPALEATSPDLKSVSIQLKPAAGKPWSIQGEISPRVSFKTHLDKVDVAIFRAALPSLPEVTGNLSGEAQFVSRDRDYLVSFLGSASELVHPKSRIGSATIRMEAATDLTSVLGLNVDVSDISANQVGVLGVRYPGMGGRIALHLEGPPANLQGSLTLDKASFRQEDFPTLRAAFGLKQDVLTLNPVDIATDPPLKVTGQLGMKDNSLRIYTELQGQSIAQLSRLLGLQPNSEIQGRLTGPLYLEGTTANPQVRFKGSITEMMIRGVAVGQGALEVQAAQALTGQLTFAQPVDGAAFGKTFGIQGLVRVAGAHLGGTPSQPRIDPILLGPSLQMTGNQGGPSVKIGDFRLPLPTIRR